jgi:hypothetical protein
MNRHVFVSMSAVVLSLSWTGLAQEAKKEPAPAAPKKAATKEASKQASSGGGTRKLAPGVIITIPPETRKEQLVITVPPEKDAIGSLGLVIDEQGVGGRGVRVTSVVAGGPADMADIKKDDVITEVNRKPLRRASDLPKALDLKDAVLNIEDTIPDAKAEITLEREGKPQTVKVRLPVRRPDLLRLLDKDRNFGERKDPKDPTKLLVRNLAKDVRIQYELWALEFNFKPVRMVQVDVPRPGAKFDRKLIWYMVYNVRNLGQKPVKFVPRILMYTDQKVKLANGEEIPKIYADRLIPVAMAPIRRREDPRRIFLDTVEISKTEIQPSTATEDNSVWGVITWEDIDPNVDYFSIYIQGLTNAYKIETVTEKDDEGKEQEKWTYLRKTLELNFWRPGDEFFENEREIRYGQPNNVEHRWVYK